MGKQAVFINVDETSIPLARPDLKGNIVPGKYSLQQKGKRYKGCLDPRGQHLQPIRHPAVSSASDFEQHTCCDCCESEAGQIVVALQPETVRLVRGKTGWSTAASFVEYLKMLRDALSLWPDIQPILVMDCAPAHLADSVIQAANNQGLLQLFALPN